EYAKRPPVGVRAGLGAARRSARSLRHDWQSAGVRRVSFFSLAYLSAATLTIGLMICSSACSQSDVKLHLLPSQVCTRAQVEPMWSWHEVDNGRITPAKPSASSFF